MTPDNLRTLLIVLLAAPLAGAAAAALLGPGRRQAARAVALAVTLGELVVAGVLISEVAPTVASHPATFAAGERPTFLPEAVPGATADLPHQTTWDVVQLGSGDRRAAVQFFVGLDGLNLWLVGLTCLLAVVAVLGSWHSVADQANAYYAWLLVLQTATLGVFVSFDVVLFYAFFELTLIPLYFLISLWGGAGRREAAGKYFLYMLAGSLITLVGVAGVVWAAYLRTDELTFAVPRLVEVMQLPPVPRLDTPENRAFLTTLQTALFLTLAAGFIVKVPLVPLHTWLPTAYTEAPTPVTVLLSGVLAKMGTYGLLRLVIPLLPQASVHVGLPLLGSLGLAGLVYGALCAYAQTDLKKLVAYGSLSHLGFLTLGLFSMTGAGLAGGLLHMLNHGLYTAGLFLAVGFVTDRYGTRQIADLGGLGAKLPWLTVLTVVLCLAGVGLPGLNGFVGEMLMLAGTFAADSASVSGPWLAAGAVLGIVLGAWYTFTMLRRVFFGPARVPDPSVAVTDATPVELAALVPLVVLCVWLGVRPQPLLDVSAPDVAVVTHLADQARTAPAPKELAR